jgi:hypothetical protein
VTSRYLEGFEQHHVDETVEALLGLLDQQRQRCLEQRLAETGAVRGQLHECLQEVQVDDFLVFVVEHEDLDDRVVVAVTLEKAGPCACTAVAEFFEAALEAVDGQVRVVGLKVFEKRQQRFVLLA